MKVIIGIVARPGVSETGKETFYVHKKVTDAIITNGGIPLIIVPTTTEKLYNKNISNTLFYNGLAQIKKIIDQCAGVIFQGGDEFYDYDLKIMRYLYDKDIPTLGICLGMQTMGYLFDGQIKDVINHNSDDEYVHMVKLKKNSNLYNIVKSEMFMVNSRHKSQLLGTKLDVVGIATDNVIEAVEDKHKKFFIGVGWHPESLKDDYIQNKLFKKFIEICGG